MMVDSERGLGRPDRALELGRSVAAAVPRRSRCRWSWRSRCRARASTSAIPRRPCTSCRFRELDPDTAFSYSPALFDAYATVLEELGRTDEAEEWYARSDLAAAALRSDDDTQADAEEETIEIAEEDVPDDADQAGSV